MMPTTATLHVRAANFAFLLLLPILFLEGVSLTRDLVPGTPLYGLLDTLSRDPRLQTANQFFTLGVLIGPLLAIALCLLAVLRLDWRREPGGFVTTVHVRDHVLPLVTIAISLAALALLFAYAFFENFVPR